MYVLINTIQMLIYHTVNARLSLEKKKGTKCAFVCVEGGGGSDYAKHFLIEFLTVIFGICK